MTKDAHPASVPDVSPNLYTKENNPEILFRLVPAQPYNPPTAAYAAMPYLRQVLYSAENKATILLAGMLLWP